MGTANNVLIGLGFFVILLIVYFQGSKKKAFPSRLNMRASAVESASAVPSNAADVPLNVIFNYNGHSFDAYETLGVAPGSSWDEVRTAFEKSISESKDSPQDFYLAAFNAIKTRQKF